MPLKLGDLRAVLSLSGDTATLTITATSGTLNKIYFVYQMMSNSSTTADVQLTLVDLIQLVANINLSSVPFINSFEIYSMAFTALFETLFESDSPLHRYTRGIPKGISAYFNVLISECLVVEVRYYVENLLHFEVPKICTISLSSLLSQILIIKYIIKVLPPPISDLLGSDINEINFNPTTKTLLVNASLDEYLF